MSGINVSRWLLGGLVASALIWVFEGAASVLYMADMEAALAAHGLGMPMTAGTWVLSVVVSLIVGLTLVFFYAATRPRLGPGPRTAVTVAVVLWAAGYLLSLIGLGMFGLFPQRLLVLWGAVGLVEMIVAGLVGAWLYREEVGT